MNCRSFQNCLHEYLDGALSPRQKASAQEHLAGCVACSDALRQEQQRAESLGAEMQRMSAFIELDRGLQQRIMRGVQQEAAPAGTGWRFLRFALASFSIVLLCLGVAHFFNATRVPHVKTAAITPRLASSSASIEMSYCLPTYTFERSGNAVIDVLTCEPHVVNAPLLSVTQ